jgi:hypothetical protein
MISLKSYCGPLSQILGMTPDALYERQRVLFRGGQLTGAIAGKGPGSGIRATVRNVTRLLLSTLAADVLSEIDEKTRKLAAIKHVERDPLTREPRFGGKCPLTGELRFQNALEKILASTELAKSVIVTVRREKIAATITYETEPTNYSVSHFGLPGLPAFNTPDLIGFGRQITATLGRSTMERIADDLQDIVGVPMSAHVPD